MSNAISKYNGFSLEDARDIDEDFMGKSSWMKLVKGNNVVRFLPGKGAEKPFLLIYQHAIPSGNATFYFPCPSKMGNISCPACTALDSIRSNGANSIDSKVISILAPRKKIYSNVIDRAAPLSGPKILSFGKTIWVQLKSIREDEDTGGDFTDLKTGRDIVIQRLGTSYMTTSYVCRVAKQSAVSDVSILEEVRGLSYLSKLKPMDEVESVVNALIYGDSANVPAQNLITSRNNSGTIVDASYEAADDVPF